VAYLYARVLNLRTRSDDLQTLTRSYHSSNERVVAAALSQPSFSDHLRRCLFDNGASENITSSYHGEVAGTRRATEVPQGFQQGTGKLRCDSTFLARRDIAGIDSSKVASTLMTWQHTDATQFEIVSEAYLRDKMGCSFVDYRAEYDCIRSWFRPLRHE
jgi:hypothetical protein